MADQPITSRPPSSLPTDRIHVFWHEGMLNYDTGIGVFDTGMDPGFLDVLEKHPENADRVKNMLSILKRGPIAPFISWHLGRPAVISELLSFHTQGGTDSAYITRRKALGEEDKMERLCLSERIRGACDNLIHFKGNNPPSFIDFLPAQKTGESLTKLTKSGIYSLTLSESESNETLLVWIAGGDDKDGYLDLLNCHLEIDT
ncbi:unnamed protein product [Ilex paraguariensis]|uniref:Uncharacterized protein n=1 Tax=Ilex paraguariensis TaxID=185542 RepID=A0ABC8SL26_9AQUA